MKIAMFSDNFYPEISGISDSIIATGKELGKLGHEVAFFVPSYSKKNYLRVGIPSKREIDLGHSIEVHRLFSLPYPAPTQQARMVIPTGSCLLKIRDFKPDIIHSQLFFGAGLEALLAAKIFKVPFVGTNHTAITEFVRYAPIKARWLEKLSLDYVNWYYGECEITSAPSGSVFAEMEKSGFKGVRKVVSNPVDMEAFNVVADYDKDGLKRKFNLSGNAVVYAGRFAPEKNIDIIVRAIALAKGQIPDITLAMAGHGASFDDIKKLVTDLGIEENVRFVGTLNRFELADLYRASEVFAITSTSETQSMTLIQAMACGLPAVGVRARALPEYIEGNGLLVDPGDSESLAEKIVELLRNHKLRGELSEKSLGSVQKFSDRNVALQWEGIYKKVLNERK
ncbi:MAG: glycosyltransferase [Parcubacteria group bacterium]